MALMNCPECNQEISNQADKCPNCGYPINKIKRRKTWKIIGIVCVAVLIIVIGGFFLFRDFWAKVFLSEDQYRVYQAYSLFKNTSGLNSYDGTFYYEYLTNEDTNTRYLGLRWVQMIENNVVLCRGSSIIESDIEVAYNNAFDIFIPEAIKDTATIKKITNSENYHAYDTKLFNAFFMGCLQDEKEKVEIKIIIDTERVEKYTNPLQNLDNETLIVIPFLFR